MTAEQKADLDRIMGTETQLLTWTKTVDRLEELTPLLRQADVVAAVLPLELLAELLRMAGEKPVLQAVCERTLTGRTASLPDGRREPEVRYTHRCWQRLLRVEVEAQQL